mgnify:CR=1 FL=1
MPQEDQQIHKFSDEQIKTLAGFLDWHKRVHIRLMQSGFTIREGKLIPPTFATTTITIKRTGKL